MALPERKTSNGWLSQAERLAVMHGTAGTKAIAAADLARPQPLMKLAKARLEFSPPEEPEDPSAREIQLVKELELAREKIIRLERSVAREISASASLKQELEVISEQLGAAEAKIGYLEKQIATGKQTAALHENETLSLETSLDLVSAENSRLQAQMKLSESMLGDAEAQAKDLWNEAAASESKRVAHLREAERYRAEAEAKETLLETSKSRAELAERLHVETRERLSLSVKENSRNVRKIAELTDLCNDKSRIVEELRDASNAQQIQIDELERSRRDLTAATGALLTSYQNHQSAWLQSESRATEPPGSGQLAVELPTVSGEDIRRGTWIELARELAKLSLKRQLAAPGRIVPTPTFLADTISF